MKRIWFPQFWQLEVRKNESYLHSAFIGITAPFLTLPYVVWNAVLKPLLTMLLTVGAMLVIVPLAGLVGLMNVRQQNAVEHVMNRLLKEMKQRAGQIEELAKTKQGTQTPS